MGRGDQPHDIALTEPVAMEVLAGVRPPDLHRVGTMLDALPILSVSPHEDYRQAAFIYHAVRASGHTVRSLNDCLIGAVALRHDAVLLDDDRDFGRIAQVTSLRRWRETG